MDFRTAVSRVSPARGGPAIPARPRSGADEPVGLLGRAGSPSPEDGPDLAPAAPEGSLNATVSPGQHGHRVQGIPSAPREIRTLALAVTARSAQC
jgi:hypothetical protein